MSPQDNLRDVEENNLVAEERYFRLLGLDGHTELWHNTTVPAIVTYARGDDHAMAVSFVRAAAKLPYTVLLYNLGLKPHSLALVSMLLLLVIQLCKSVFLLNTRFLLIIFDFCIVIRDTKIGQNSGYNFRILNVQHTMHMMYSLGTCILRL